MNKRILITGASGFIGSFLVEKALSRNYETWAGVRPTSNKQYLQDPRIQFIDLNYSNKEALTEQLRHTERFDYIIHNAGLTKALHPEEFDKVNFRNTANLIDALIEANRVPDKFVMMSSLSVMGVGDEIGYTPIRPSDIPRPNTAYGTSKLRADNYLQSKPNFPHIILRPTGVYGPREHDYFLMIKTILSGLDVSAGMRPQHLTFIYADDLAEIALLSAESPLSARAYLVADGDVHTDKEYTSLIRKLLNKNHVFRIKIPIFVIFVVAFVSEKLAKLTSKTPTLNLDKFKIMRQRNWACDTSALQNELGFRPKFSLEAGLKASIDWYRKNGWI